METFTILQDIRYGFAAIFLLIESIYDLKSKKISIPILVIFIIPSFLLALYIEKTNFLTLVIGAFIGLGVLGLSFLTKEGIGYGDAIILIGTGLVLGWRINLIMLFTGLFLSSVISIVLLIKKMDRKMTIPFVPFITCAFFFILLTGGLG